MSNREAWAMVPRPVRHFPADLVATLGLTGLVPLAVWLPVVNETPVRFLVAIPFLLFAPGYAFIAALFPASGAAPGSDAADGADDGVFDRGIDGVERVTFAIGASIALVPFLVLWLDVTPVGIRLVPALVCLVVFTVGAVAVAARRRHQLPEERRFRVPYRSWLAATKTEYLDTETRFETALNVVLVVAFIVFASSVVYAIATPQPPEQYSEFYVLSENDSGELVAEEYPEELVVGEPATLHVGVSNHEFESTEYTVVVQLERYEGAGEEFEVLERTEVDRWSLTLAHNETERQARDIVADGSVTGENVRLVFLLYEDGVPADPRSENAPYALHIPVSVSE